MPRRSCPAWRKWRPILPLLAVSIVWGVNLVRTLQQQQQQQQTMGGDVAASTISLAFEAPHVGVPPHTADIRRNSNATDPLHYTTSSSSTTRECGDDDHPLGIFLPETPDGSLAERLRRDLSDDSYNEISSSCSATCQVQVLLPKQEPKRNCSSSSSSSLFFWELQTFDEQGTPKTTGGDEFYVTYYAYTGKGDSSSSSNIVNSYNTTTPATDPGAFFTAAAWVTDLQNGRYRLDFQCGPFSSDCHPQQQDDGGGGGGGDGGGILTVYFQYTCGIGRMGPPTKASWSTGGTTVARYATRVLHAPPLRVFQPPTSTITNTTTTTTPSIINLNDFEAVLPIGDSLLQQFLQPLLSSSAGTTHHTILRFSNIGQPLNTSTVQQWKDHLTHKYGKKKGLLHSNRTALLLGSAVWDLLEDQQQQQQATTTTTTGDLNVATTTTTIWDTNHGQAWHEFISYIRTAYPQVTILWKSPTALHVHVPMMQVLLQQQQQQQQQQGTEHHQLHALERTFGKHKFYQRLRYMSTSRSLDLYHAQQQWCHDEQIPFLDVYAASYLAADETQLGDGRHFSARLNTRMIHWFVNESHVETLWRYRQQQLMTSSSSSTSSSRRWLMPPPLPQQEQQPCPTWINVVNSVIVALLTGRILIWNHPPPRDKLPSESCPSSPLMLLPMTSSSFPPPDLKSADVVYLYPSEHVWSLRELEQQGFLPSEPSKRLAAELFSQGEGYLYGMVLRKMVFSSWRWPNDDDEKSGPPPLSLSTPTSRTTTTVAVLNEDGKILEKERLDRCLDNIFTTNILDHHPRAFKTTCRVILSSPEILPKVPLTNMDPIKTTSGRNCTVQYSTSATSSGDRKNNGTLFLLSPDESSLSFLNDIVQFGDAILLPCNDDGDDDDSPRYNTLLLHLVNYLRQSQARREGRLPLPDLPHCCF